MSDRKIVDIREYLYRRGYCTPERNYMNPDGTATSRVFKLREKDQGELSVDVKRLTSAEIAIGDTSKFMLFEVPNRVVEAIDLQTFHDPLPEGRNNAHAVICGMTVEDDLKPGLLARKSKRVYL